MQNLIKIVLLSFVLFNSALQATDLEKLCPVEYIDNTPWQNLGFNDRKLNLHVSIPATQLYIKKSCYWGTDDYTAVNRYNNTCHIVTIYCEGINGMRFPRTVQEFVDMFGYNLYIANEVKSDQKNFRLFEYHYQKNSDLKPGTTVHEYGRAYLSKHHLITIVVQKEDDSNFEWKDRFFNSLILSK